jgi:flavin-dependent dehydrogenase
MVAIRLAEAGCMVTLLEKEQKAHHKVCGEFLSCEAMQYLQQVGIEPVEMGAAPIHSVRLSARRNTMEVVLPFRACSLSRFALDEALLARAREMGCEVRRGAFVESLEEGGKHWRIQIRGGDHFVPARCFAPPESTIFMDGAEAAESIPI